MVTLSREEEEENAVFRNINLADAARKLDVVTIPAVAWLGLNMTYTDLMAEGLFPNQRGKELKLLRVNYIKQSEEELQYPNKLQNIPNLPKRSRRRL